MTKSNNIKHSKYNEFFSLVKDYDKPVMILGNVGCGKSTAIRQAAEQLKTDLYYLGSIENNKDLKILNKNNLRFTGISKQRLGCLCPGNKLELLNHKYRCDNKCVYCYWKDKNEH